jgi:hypothetical protein
MARTLTGLTLGAVLLFPTVLMAPDAAQASPRGDRLDRQIEMFEGLINQVLVESPNFLIRDRDVTHGWYRDDRGAVFTFRTSLVDGRHHDGWGFLSWLDDHGVVVRDRDGDRVSRKEWKKDLLEDQEDEYKDGKDELIQALMDFGPALTALSDNESIEIRADLRDAEYFKANDLRRLTLKVKMSDLRSFDAGRLSEDELRRRIEIDES